MPGGAGGPPPGIGGGPPPGLGGPPPGLGGRPPGLNGGPSNPFAGGNQSQGQDRPPAGAATRPNLANKIEPFYSFAFDNERSEFYTIAMRQDPKYPQRALGELRRYSYPDFKQKSAFRIPNLGTRAVIDSKSGLLFIAAATNQNRMVLTNLWNMAYDRAFGTGDVHVFDLKPIQDGKVADESDLKPTGSMPMNGTIRGLELSNDGKFLFVAVTRSAGGRSKTFIRKFEAADRKFIKEVALPEEALDVRKSADGKKLIAIEYDSTNRKPKVQIMICDPETLEVKTKRSPGIVTDVASHPDDSMVVAVAGAPEQVGSMPNLKSGQMHSIDAGGDMKEFLMTSWKASNSNFAKFTPDGKHLFVSSIAGRDKDHLQNAGLDVYVPDKKQPSGFKKAASIRSVIWVNSGVSIGGYFEVTPDGENLVFHNGAVVAVDKITTNAEGADSIPEPGGAAGGGFPGAGGAGFPGAGGAGFPAHLRAADCLVPVEHPPVAGFPFPVEHPLVDSLHRVD